MHSYPSRTIDPNDEMLGVYRRSVTNSTGDGLEDFRRLRRAQSCWTLRLNKDRDTEDLHLKPEVIVRVGDPILSRPLLMFETKDKNIVFDRDALGVDSRRWSGLSFHQLSPKCFDQSCWSPLPMRLGQSEPSQLETTQQQQQQSSEDGIWTDACSPVPPQGVSTASTAEESVTIISRVYEDRDHRYHWGNQSSPTPHAQFDEENLVG